MPRNVRNVWYTIDVDGKATQVATGPRSKDGGARCIIRQRDDGNIAQACDICTASDGENIITSFIFPQDIQTTFAEIDGQLYVTVKSER